ncbi:MAG: DUF1425 domain-containing protein [Phycisphaeraceae bacterium]|nr:DUF1425 domain-containing protein [Phycisphaeraceae bacterium]MBX3367876.1 DUF1425 domain-containing protein [Phycisphaeraceae bacterium]
MHAQSTKDHEAPVRRSVRAIALGAITISALSLVSCKTSDKPPPGAMADPVLIENYPSVVALEGLQPYIGVSAPVETRTPGQPLAVQVPVRALTNGAELNVQYRFFWLNDQQVPVQEDGEWRYMRMPARSQVFMSGNALDTRATRWRLEIRPAR